MVPFEFTLRAVSVFEGHALFKLKQLVHEAEMWLDNNIEASSPYITAAIISGCKNITKLWELTMLGEGKASEPS